MYAGNTASESLLLCQVLQLTNFLINFSLTIIVSVQKLSLASSDILTWLNWIRKEQGWLVEYSLSNTLMNCASESGLALHGHRYYQTAMISSFLTIISISMDTIINGTYSATWAILIIQLFPMLTDKYDDHIITQSFHFPLQHYISNMRLTRN